MKSPYYVANVVNAYRYAIDRMDMLTQEEMEMLKKELCKTSHRQYTTGFYFGDKNKEYLQSSMPVQTSEFMASVIGDSDGEKTLIEQRNRFKVGDTLEVLSPNVETFNKQIKIEKMTDENGNNLDDAKDVQQKLYIWTNLPLKSGDILRKEITEK